MTAPTQDIFNLRHPRDCRIAPSTRWGRIGGYWAMRRCRSRRAREIRALRGLSDHLLGDIGLSRSDVGYPYGFSHSSDQTIRILSGR